MIENIFKILIAPLLIFLAIRGNPQEGVVKLLGKKETEVLMQRMSAANTASA